MKIVLQRIMTLWSNDSPRVILFHFLFFHLGVLQVVVFEKWGINCQRLLHSSCSSEVLRIQTKHFSTWSVTPVEYVNVWNDLKWHFGIQGEYPEFYFKIHVIFYMPLYIISGGDRQVKFQTVLEYHKFVYAITREIWTMIMVVSQN